MKKKLVIIESPYAGDRELNDAYLDMCMWDCIARGDVPFASHAIYTRILDDNDNWQRSLGIRLGLEIADRFDETIMYCDLGKSRGMELGQLDAETAGRAVSWRWMFDGGKPTAEQIYELKSTLIAREREKNGMVKSCD